MIDKSLTISAFLLLFSAMPTIAQVQISQEHIQFQPGTTGTTIQGQLQGDSENNNPTAPYTTAEYDATTILDCEVRDSVDLTTPVTHNQHCPAGILRGDVGSASVRIMLPTGEERVLNFAAQDITTPDDGELTWGKEDDNWFVGIDNREFYVIPEIVVYGD